MREYAGTIKTSRVKNDRGWNDLGACPGIVSSKAQPPSLGARDDGRAHARVVYVLRAAPNGTFSLVFTARVITSSIRGSGRAHTAVRPSVRPSSCSLGPARPSGPLRAAAPAFFSRERASRSSRVASSDASRARLGRLQSSEYTAGRNSEEEHEPPDRGEDAARPTSLRRGFRVPSSPGSALVTWREDATPRVRVRSLKWTCRVRRCVAGTRLADNDVFPQRAQRRDAAAARVRVSLLIKPTTTSRYLPALGSWPRIFAPPRAEDTQRYRANIRLIEVITPAFITLQMRRDEWSAPVSFPAVGNPGLEPGIRRVPESSRGGEKTSRVKNDRGWNDLGACPGIVSSKAQPPSRRAAAAAGRREERLGEADTHRASRSAVPRRRHHRRFGRRQVSGAPKSVSVSGYLRIPSSGMDFGLIHSGNQSRMF
ncbi:hypothetical protein DBV15_00957 [Temnothorax longispinosus]|uniref:Uncharacterized protein n=1 Tax=Temnothorax longispinosus TaxID=300112 RepID=A0A4S2JBN6_9HYME|nr:hypothetical protein DBV15_00957 [Temnothorax longispinosus]